MCYVLFYFFPFFFLLCPPFDAYILDCLSDGISNFAFGSCYYTLELLSDWSEATFNCHKFYGGHLVFLNSSQESEFVSVMIPGSWFNDLHPGECKLTNGSSTRKKSDHTIWNIFQTNVNWQSQSPDIHCEVIQLPIILQLALKVLTTNNMCLFLA